MKRKFAQNTSVPVSRSQEALNNLLCSVGATGFISGKRGKKIIVGFELEDRAIRLDALLPTDGDSAQEERRMWRALLLIVKAKLEAAASGITTFEHEFMPYFVMKDGRTLAEQLLPQIEGAVESGAVLKLLSM